MRKTLGYFAAVWAICIAVFNVICFATPRYIAGTDKFAGAFWVGYAFITAAFLGQLACAFIAFRTENLQKLFLNLPLFKISYRGLFSMLVAGSIVMLIPNLPKWIGVTAESPFIAIEQQDFLQYTRSVIAAAMETLEPKQKAVLTEKYINKKSWKYCAEKCEFASKQSACEAAERALNKLARGKYSSQLRECLDEFNDYNEYKQASHSNGISSFYRYGVSSIEAVALLKEGGFENEQ